MLTALNTPHFHVIHAFLLRRISHFHGNCDIMNERVVTSMEVNGLAFNAHIAEDFRIPYRGPAEHSLLIGR